MNRFRLTRRGAVTGLAALALAENAALAAPKPVHQLWPVSGPPVLRGAVIAQRRRRDSVDGTGNFGGPGPAIPAYAADDFQKLAEAGANLVVMSFPELWTEAAPWKRNAKFVELLLRQMDQARAAGLYVVVGLRSGPGRSDFVFHRDGAGAWFPATLIRDDIWRAREAQAAWREMCVDVAKLIAGRKETAGLIPMVEPDPQVGGLAKSGAKLFAWEPDAYARDVAQVSDWKRIVGDVARAVRKAAPNLPLLISPPAFANPDFVSVMGAPPVEGVVWCVHDYEPRDFTHFPKTSAGILHFSERADAFANRITAAKAAGVPVFLGEFGAARWSTGVPAYMRARLSVCETQGVNSAVFRWPTSNADYEKADDMFNVRLGEDRPNAADEPPAEDTLREFWKKNTRRP